MYEQIARNRRDSWLLAGLVVAILAALGFAIGYAAVGGTQGGLGLLGVFGVVAILWSVVGYYSGDRMVLAVSGARRVTHADEPQLFNVVEEMTIAAGLSRVPAVYVLEDAAPNAFATGRDPEHASVAVTRGLLERLDREQLQGVADLLKYSLIVVATVPILCIYPFVQKYFVKGVMIGSLKG